MNNKQEIEAIKNSYVGLKLGEDPNSTLREKIAGAIIDSMTTYQPSHIEHFILKIVDRIERAIESDDGRTIRDLRLENEELKKSLQTQNIV
jgi:hypothetical protein